jgi:hypothetical protein
VEHILNIKPGFDLQHKKEKEKERRETEREREYADKLLK